MAQPYDLSGFVPLHAVFDQMVLDQTRGTVKFAGGSQTWLSSDPGWFKAKLSSGGSLAATTTANIRALLETLRINFDLLAASAGTLATAVAVTAQSPPLPLASGAFSASGAVTAGTQVIANTNYDLSSLANLQTTATQMIADQQTGVTNFGGGANPNTFSAILSPGAAAQTTTMPVVRGRLAAARARFDLLDM